MKRLHLGLPTGLLVMGLLSVGLRPVPLAASPFAYVANLVDSSVAVIDVATASVVATIQGKTTCPSGPCFLMNQPAYVAITPDGQYAWVTNEAANFNNISVISTAVNGVANVVPAETAAQLPSCSSGGLCRSPGAIAINPKADSSGRIWAYVTNQVSGTVSVIDTASALTSATPTTSTVPLPPGARPYAVAVTPDGTQVYVTDSASASVYVIDTAIAVVSTINLPFLGGRGLGVAFSPDGAHAYVSTWIPQFDPAFGYPYDIFDIDTATKNAVEAFGNELGPEPGIVVTPDGSRVYFTSQDISIGYLVAIGPTDSGATVGNFPFGISIAPPGSAAFTFGGNATFVTNSGDNTVSVINTTTFTTAVPPIPVGTDPLGIAIQGSLTGQASSGMAAMAGVPLNLVVTGPTPNLVGSVTWDFFSNGRVVQNTSVLDAKYAYPTPGTYLLTVTVRSESGAPILKKTVPLPIQSTAQGIATAVSLVKLLKSLTAAQQAGLLNTLGAASSDLLAGNRAAASNQISLFISQLNGLVQTGQLTAKAAAPTLGEGKAIQISLAQSAP